MLSRALQMNGTMSSPKCAHISVLSSELELGPQAYGRRSRSDPICDRRA